MDLLETSIPKAAETELARCTAATANVNQSPSPAEAVILLSNLQIPFFSCRTFK